MADRSTNQPASPLPPWSRPFALASAFLFLISSVFPIAAGLSQDPAAFPSWWGTLDVALAFSLAIMALVISILVRGRVTKQIEATAYRAYRVLFHGILAL